MHQAGVENVVASSGTSLTEGQIRLLRRFTNNVTLIYDADPAGIKASLRGINMLLDEKLDVKVLLLPPGDDPDSFAQNHSSSEVEKYLAEHEEDIIAFMTRVLMRDVPPNDPTARAKVINVILGSVAHIDDPVKRQEYLQQCSRMLGLAEEVLVRQLNILIAKRYEEAETNEARRAARESLGELDNENAAAKDKPEAEQEEAPLLNLNVNRLKPFEEILARYLVRYGLLYIVNMTDAEGNDVPATVYDVISSELAADGITFTHKPYQAVFEAIGAIRNGGAWLRIVRQGEIEDEVRMKLEEAREKLRIEGGSMAKIEKVEAETRMELAVFREERINEFDMQYGQNLLVNSPDDMVRNTALELLVDRYTISRFYTRQGDNLSEQAQLPSLVPSAIYELRNAIVSDIIKDLTMRLSGLPAERAEEAFAIMKEIQERKELQQRLTKALGDRIILPGAISQR